MHSEQEPPDLLMLVGEEVVLGEQGAVEGGVEGEDELGGGDAVCLLEDRGEWGFEEGEEGLGGLVQLLEEGESLLGLLACGVCVTVG